MRRHLAQQCRYASMASYVTKQTLQKRYPSSCWSTHYSTIDMPPEMILDDSVVCKRMARIEAKCKLGDPLRLCFVGSISQMYKAPDILIAAVSVCLDKGINLELFILGDGQYKRKLEDQARSLGIAEKVFFLGNVPTGKAVYEQLDNSDLFVLPSRTEGLPRSLIEAMARGLPCIGSHVGGIPELLDEDYMVPAGQVEPLAQKLQEVIGNKAMLEQMSKQNLKKAYEYCIDVLRERRRECYEKLADITRAWRLENGGKTG